jgi:hypothetical protein
VKIRILTCDGRRWKLVKTLILHSIIVSTWILHHHYTTTREWRERFLLLVYFWVLFFLYFYLNSIVILLVTTIIVTGICDDGQDAFFTHNPVSSYLFLSQLDLTFWVLLFLQFSSSFHINYYCRAGAVKERRKFFSSKQVSIFDFGHHCLVLWKHLKQSEKQLIFFFDFCAWPKPFFILQFFLWWYQ